MCEKRADISKTGLQKNCFCWNSKDKYILGKVMNVQIKSLLLKSYSNRTFLCWKSISPTFYCSKSKKCQFVGINFLAENSLNDEFYWPNVFHYWFKIQSLTLTLPCRSQNLQPANTFKKHWWIWLLKNGYIIPVPAFRVVKVFCSSFWRT